MINYNGSMMSKNQDILNRGFKYGDSVFDTIKVINKKIIFSEDHYFRLMASMRMLRMEIPLDFTLEYYEQEIFRSIDSNNLKDARVRVNVYRSGAGAYLPETNEIDFVIEVFPLIENNKDNYIVDLYKDYYNYSGVLSTIKTNNRVINTLSNIYAEENNLDSCILLNENKHVCETINGNIFLVKDDKIITPSIDQGCIKGVVRKKLIELIQKIPNYTIEERAVSPFELQKVDEVFITNSIVDIQPITNYRKKVYSTKVSSVLKANLKTLY